MLHTIVRSLMLATYMKPQRDAARRCLPRDLQGDLPRLRWQRDDPSLGGPDAGERHD